MPRTPLQGLAFLIGFVLALWLRARARCRAQPVGDPEAARLEALLYEQVNGVRAQHHLVALTRQPELDGVARAHSGDMASRGYLAHESPEGDEPLDRLERGRVDGFSMAAENIGMTSKPTPASEIVAAWMRSPDPSHQPAGARLQHHRHRRRARPRRQLDRDADVRDVSA